MFLFCFLLFWIDLLLLESTYVHNFRKKVKEKMLFQKQINMNENMKSLRFLGNKIRAWGAFNNAAAVINRRKA